jgi:cysteinyl-tRNA synthetase
MAEKHLGESIDIHAGGQDLVFPHHENEIAQSRCAHGGKPFARYWMHNGFVTVNRRKMSKSLGNTLTVHELLKRERGEVLRYQLLSAHYRQPLDWSEAALSQSQRTLDRMYAVLRNYETEHGPIPDPSEPGAAFTRALHDDLNTPVALAEMNQTARRLGGARMLEDAQELAGRLMAEANMIGVLQESPDEWFSGDGHDDEQDIERLIAEREQARDERNFAKADEIRDTLTDMGIALEDGPNGTLWRREDQGS